MRILLYTAIIFSACSASTTEVSTRQDITELCLEQCDDDYYRNEKSCDFLKVGYISNYKLCKSEIVEKLDSCYQSCKSK